MGQRICLASRKHCAELRASIAALTFSIDRSVMRFNQRFANGQTQPETAQLASPGLFKSMKNSWENLIIDATTGIFHFQPKFSAAIIARPNAELPSARRKLHRVLD